MARRLLSILLAFHTVAFVAHAGAAEHGEGGTDGIKMMMEAGQRGPIDETEETLSELADLGARLLKWRFTSKEEREAERYASERVVADHGIAVVEDGAALNLTWRF